MAPLMLAAVFAFMACGDAVVVKAGKKKSMSYGQDKKNKRSASFNNGKVAKKKVSEPMSALDINATVAEAQQDLLDQVLHFFLKSNYSNALKQQLETWVTKVQRVRINNTLVSQKRNGTLLSQNKSKSLLEEKLNQMSNSRFSPHMTGANVYNRQGIPITDAQRANELVGENNHEKWIGAGLDKAYFKTLKPEQIVWLIENGYVDKYYRLSEKFMSADQMALYNFMLQTRPQNRDFLQQKFLVIDAFCSHFFISSCPFLPGYGLNDENADKLLYTEGSFAQSQPEFELGLIKYLRLNSATPISKTASISSDGQNSQILPWNGGFHGANNGDHHHDLEHQYDGNYKYAPIPEGMHGTSGVTDGSITWSDIIAGSFPGDGEHTQGVQPSATTANTVGTIANTVGLTHGQKGAGHHGYGSSHHVHSSTGDAGVWKPSWKRR